MISFTSRSTQPKNWTSEEKATLPREAHLVITTAPSDRGSSASLDEGAFLGRKRSFAEAMGADEGLQVRSLPPVPQVFPPGPRGHYKYGIASGVSTIDSVACHITPDTPPPFCFLLLHVVSRSGILSPFVVYLLGKNSTHHYQ